ncbi:MAG TPA: thiosulfate sulfurtransferase, partial [Rhodospirillaceae bacterium]|nr:thiosulfate sulfurtransferase [Rhodospirillaceae bacterium]
MTNSVTPAELKKLLHDGGEMALLDVREDGQFGEGHLLYANPCAYSHMEARVGERVPRKSTRLVLVDGGDGIADKAAKRLGELGYTDISILEGGVDGWAAAGYVIFKGVNVPCKAFGEVVEHQANTPRIPPEDLVAMTEKGEKHVILDGRTPAEFNRMNIPGGISVPNGELVYRVHDFAPDADTTVVVNCAGRTRSIIGAQTLINAGLPNKIVALKGGTMGWTLSGFELENGATRRYGTLSDEAKEVALERAGAIQEKLGIEAVSIDTVQEWQADSERTLFLLDVRSAEEFAEGHMPGSAHAPGGQLVQATDQWAATLGARIVLLDDENNVRAVMTAHWLKQMGWDVSVLAGGVLPHANETGTPKAP